jgi:cell wall-associated NlpC family hydrolase
MAGIGPRRRLRLSPSRYVLAGVLAMAVIVVAAVVLLGGGGQPTTVQPSKLTVAGGPPGVGAGSAGAPTSAGTAAKSGAVQTGTKQNGAQGPASSTRSASHGAASGASNLHTGTAATGVDATGPRGAVAEVRDPEEAKSFPLPASVHHSRASSPGVAAEAAIAPGAASDAEIRKELGEEARAKARERAAQRRVLTPVTGGFSVGGNGTIPIPTDVPESVQRVIAGGNAIADFPYIWGGGHGSFVANGYDCSGSVSYALAAGGLLSSPLVSGDLARWGEPGPGRWITIYANAGHTFMSVDGMWFDTAGRSGPYASRWLVSTPPLAGYSVRHPPGL